MVIHVREVVDKVGCSLYQWVGQGIAKLRFGNVRSKKNFPELGLAGGAPKRDSNAVATLLYLLLGLKRPPRASGAHVPDGWR